MKKIFFTGLFSLLLVLTTFNAWAMWQLLRIDELVFPSSGSEAISVFNGNPADASLVITGKIPGQRTAIDFWPVNGLLPTQHALTETVWYRTRFMDWPNFERISLSGIADGSMQGPHYRFSVEKGGAGQLRPILFCFDITGQPAYCPLKIDPVQGV